MAQNSSITLLDPPQVIKRVYDESNDAIRVEVGSGTGFQVSLSSNEGDSITNVPNQGVYEVSVTSSSSGIILGPVPCNGMKSFNLYTNTTSTITGAQVVTLQVSPSDTDNVWIATTLTITPSTTSGTVVMGTTATDIVARRCQLSIASSITSGSFNIYLVSQAV